MGHNIADFPEKIQRIYREMVTGKPTRVLGKDYSKDANNKGQATLAQQIQVMGLLAPRRDYELAVEKCGRRWQADFAWTHVQRQPEDRMEACHLGVFLEGQVHAIKAQRARDCERNNVLGLVLGPRWTVLQFTSKQVRDLIAVDSIAAWISGDMGAVLAALQRKAGYL